MNSGYFSQVQIHWSAGRSPETRQDRNLSQRFDQLGGKVGCQELAADQLVFPDDRLSQIRLGETVRAFAVETDAAALGALKVGLHAPEEPADRHQQPYGAASRSRATFISLQ